MRHIQRELLLLICLTVLSISPFVTAQVTPPVLQPKQPVSFTLAPGAGKAFKLKMKRDAIAEITWLANEELILEFGIFDASGKALELGSSTTTDSALFIAPNDGDFTFILKFDESSEIKETQRISLEYRDDFEFPKRARQKDIRRINGYDIKILAVPETDDRSGNSIIVFEKTGRIKKIVRDYGSDYIGYSFSDSITLPASAAEKRSAALIKGTPDNTGDGIPDVMIDYFSGGAHCCFSTFFFNLGDTVDLVEAIDTHHAGLSAVSKNPKGELRFKTYENNFAYWNISFAGSPMPAVILEFSEGALRPNFDLLKKPPPSLTSLKIKARAAGRKISLEPYTDNGDQFEEAFWSEMLDLIYTGNEALAWQYFDIVWPAKKEGKELFLANFKEVLSESYYGTRGIESQNGFQNWAKGFYRILEQIK